MNRVRALAAAVWARLARRRPARPALHDAPHMPMLLVDEGAEMGAVPPMFVPMSPVQIVACQDLLASRLFQARFGADGRLIWPPDDEA